MIIKVKLHDDLSHNSCVNWNTLNIRLSNIDLKKQQKLHESNYTLCLAGRAVVRVWGRLKGDQEEEKGSIKWTLSVISSDPQLKMAMSDSQRCPWNLYLINNVENTVVFLDIKVFNSDYIFLQQKCANYFCKETKIEDNKFLNL